MSDEKPRKRLLHFVEKGRRTGADLVQKRNPVETAHSIPPSEIEQAIAEVEAKVDGPLWEREWASTALRSLERQIDRDALLSPLGARLRDLSRRLEENDAKEFAPLQQAIAAKTYGPKDFLAELEQRPSYQWDAFVRRLLAVQQIPDRETERPAMMVHYLPSPLDAILQIAKLVGPGDVFYDIGSGLGLVTMLVAWLSGAKSKGVEYEPAYHRRAVELADALRIDVEYVCSDARAVDYSDGTIFYLYDTFRGPILDEMMAVLEREKARSIRIISRGKSTPVLETVPWLTKVRDLESRMTLFQS